MKRFAALALIGLWGIGGAALAQMTVVNGASFAGGQPIAGGSFASMFGQNLCSQTMAGGWISPGHLPTTLGGCSITVNGSPAMMQYVSGGQINFIMPSGAGSGQAAVIVTNGTRTMTGNTLAGPAGPG